MRKRTSFELRVHLLRPLIVRIFSCFFFSIFDASGCFLGGNKRRFSLSLWEYKESRAFGCAPLPPAVKRCRLRGKGPRRNLFESFMSVYLECFCLPRGYCGSRRWFTLQYLRKRSNYCPREAPKASRDRSSPGFQLASAAEGARLMAAPDSSSPRHVKVFGPKTVPSRPHRPEH